MEPQQESDQAPQTPAIPTGTTPPATEATPPTSDATPAATTPPVTSQPQQPRVDTNAKPHSNTPPPAGKSKAAYVMLVIVLLLIVVTGVLFVMQKKAPIQQPVVAKKVISTPTLSAQATPAITPVTSANVNQTLNNTDSAMQKAVSQANTDLNSISSINTSQDSTSGL